MASKPGDVVSLILIGHGSTEGIVLGGNILNPAELAAACSIFPADVQVNIIVKACYCDKISKAFRVANQRNLCTHTSANSNERSFSARRSISDQAGNSIFGAAFVHTLGLMPDTDEIRTLEKQADFLEKQLNRARIPSKRYSTPQVVLDSAKTTLMLDILSRNYVGITISNGRLGRARRLMTSPDFSRRIASQQRRYKQAIYLLQTSRQLAR